MSNNEKTKNNDNEIKNNNGADDAHHDVRGDRDDTTVAPAPALPDPFNPESLRLKPDAFEEVGVKKLITHVAAEKPGRQPFVRTHKGKSYWLETAVLEVEDLRETYLVNPGLWDDLAGEIVPKLLVTTITLTGNLSLWPIGLPRSDGRTSTWHESALAAARAARDHWVRVQSDMSLRAYRVQVATGKLPEPEWPDLSFQQILAIAFRDRFIDTLDHPVLRKLRGES